jgi:monofunctional biosynthetic peptidoglycan transglycosylase
MRPRLRRWLAVAVALSGAAFASLGLLWRGLPDPRPLADPAWVQQRFGLSQWAPLDALPGPAVRAILISEDDIFFDHDGLRLDELPAALGSSLRSLRYRRGASSITQQVVRNAFLTREKSLGRKAAEALLAIKADAVVSKRALLEGYLNLAEWGSRGERGIAAAAREHLGKAPSELNAAEGALLAWLLPQPRQRGRWLRRQGLLPAASSSVRRILARLEREGVVDAAEAERQLEALARALPAPRPAP